MRSGVMMAALAACLSLPALAQEGDYSQPARHDVPRQVYFGDTHLHTRNSADAYTLGNTGLSPDDAFRFAAGATVTAHNGMKVKLRRPLDFLAVSDHAEYFAVFARLQDGDPDLLATETGKRWRGYMDTGQDRKIFEEFVGVLLGNTAFDVPESVKRSVWASVTETADRHNMPGRFTTFSAYEWSSMPVTEIGMSNLHRIVLFRDGAEKAGGHMPFSSVDSEDPEDLWKVLDAYEKAGDGEVIAIPHNSNLSVGLLFDTKRLSGEPLTKAYAETRARWEPIVEVTQVKGDSEAHPVLSPNDEFADFETWNSWSGPTYEGVRTEGWEDRKAREYARSALKTGLQIESELGTNPFKFGMIGSTDSHTSLATTAEDNFFGKFPGSEPSPERWDSKLRKESTGAWALGASGLAAVWATENTRASLFDAMKRKEVYATTGSRIVLRFFGGWDYAANADTRPDYVDIGYDGGVPMGGDLTDAPRGKAPSFIMVAGKDPDGANLDRIQIVKGWLDADGNTQEKIYDVVLSDGRTVDPETGKAPPVGSTVDLEDASYTNTIGAPLLSVTWSDPDFDPAERAFYYVRVLEIPTPRWTAYDAKFFDVKMPDEVPMTIQDRAYSSPIWYTP